MDIDLFHTKIRISPVALIIFALIFYIVDITTFLAFILAAAVHELGHIAAIKALGFKFDRLTFGIFGLCIDYSGAAPELYHGAAALAGPIAGIILAYALSALSNYFISDFPELASGMSLMFSLFNLLPVLPLDGGRILLSFFSYIFGYARGLRAAGWVSAAAAFSIFAVGLILSIKGRGAAVLLFSFCLLAELYIEKVL
ncbi:MAG: site-2 protease family protein [Candidatus Limivicinus sp.]|jgi:stage IV sporulation protein FB